MLLYRTAKLCGLLSVKSALLLWILTLASARALCEDDAPNVTLNLMQLEVSVLPEGESSTKDDLVADVLADVLGPAKPSPLTTLDLLVQTLTHGLDEDLDIAKQPNASEAADGASSNANSSNASAASGASSNAKQPNASEAADGASSNANSSNASAASGASSNANSSNASAASSASPDSEATTPAAVQPPSTSAPNGEDEMLGMEGPSGWPTPVPPAARKVTPSLSEDPVPSATEIQEANRRVGCVTMLSSLAFTRHFLSSLRIAPVGTTCVFRADNWDEASHCIDAETGKFGQFGWCWTKMDRSEWGSCNSQCPLSGNSLTLQRKLDGLEALLDNLNASMKESKAASLVSSKPATTYSRDPSTRVSVTETARSRPLLELLRGVATGHMADSA